MTFHAQNTIPSADAGMSAVPFAPACGGTFLSRVAGASAARHMPRLIRSVVDEAGLGRFVYLQGGSGRRYVFSSIRREQAGLYDRALFAAVESSGGTVKISRSVAEFDRSVSVFYVHLLDDVDGNGEATLSDLAA